MRGALILAAAGAAALIGLVLASASAKGDVTTEVVCTIAFAGLVVAVLAGWR